MVTLNKQLTFGSVLIVSLVYFMIMSLSVFAAPFDVDSTISLEECGAVSDPVVFDASSCPVLQSSFESSCINTPVLVTNDDITLTLQYLSPLTGEYFCEVAVTELDTDGVNRVSLQGIDLLLQETSSADRSVCTQQTKTFAGRVTLSNILDGFGKLNNLVKLNLASGAKISDVSVTCQQGGDSRTLDTDFLFDRLSYADGNVVRMKAVIAGGGVNSDISNITAGTQYQLIFSDAKDKTTFYSYPSTCVKGSRGQSITFTCSVETNYEPFVFKINGLTSLDVTDYILYRATGDSITPPASFIHTDSKTVSAAQSRGIHADILFRTTSKAKTTIANVSYGDTLTLAEVTCPAGSSNVRLTITNANTNVTCPYVSNDNRDGTFYVSLQTRNIVAENFACGFPFEVNRSGLYEFEAVCSGTMACSGACYNPLPASTASFVTVADWQQYLFIGKTFLSHYNQNSIPDCVCDSSNTLKPISLLANDQDLAVQDWGDFP